MASTFLLWTAAALWRVDLTSAPVESLVIEGNWKTRAHVIKRELGLSRGQAFDEARWRDGLRRVRNLPMIYRAEGSVEDGPSGKVLRLDLQERWTLIPIFKIQGTAGLQTLTLGAYDVNVAGRYVELGGQYELNRGSDMERPADHSGVLWFKHPRVAGRRLAMDHELWYVQRNHPLYGDDGSMVGAFSKRRLEYIQRWRGEWMPQAFWEVRGSLTRDQVDDSLLNQETRNLNLANGFDFSHELDYGRLGAGVVLGQINRDGFLLEGQELRLDLDQWWEEDRSSWRTGVMVRQFARLGGGVNAAMRAQMTTSDEERLERMVTVGDLENIRGIRVERFRAPHTVTANLEIRFFSLKTSWLLLQHVVFYDLGNVADSSGKLFHSSAVWIQSAGTGLRFLVPKVYRLNARLDWASSFGRAPGSGISFGLQQFF